MPAVSFSWHCLERRANSVCVSFLLVNVGHLFHGTFAGREKFQLGGNDGHNLVERCGKFSHSICFWSFGLLY